MGTLTSARQVQAPGPRGTIIGRAAYRSTYHNTQQATQNTQQAMHTAWWQNSRHQLLYSFVLETALQTAQLPFLATLLSRGQGNRAN